MTWRDELQKVAASVRQEAERLWQESRASDSQAMAQLLRPNLGPTPQPLRRVLEPVVAGTALAALGALTGVGMVAFAAMFVAAGLIYLILTYVFGIQLDLELPTRPW